MEEILEDFVIDEPYSLSSDDIELIKKASPEKNNLRDWV